MDSPLQERALKAHDNQLKKFESPENFPKQLTLTLKKAIIDKMRVNKTAADTVPPGDWPKGGI